MPTAQWNSAAFDHACSSLFWCLRYNRLKTNEFALSGLVHSRSSTEICCLQVWHLILSSNCQLLGAQVKKSISNSDFKILITFSYLVGSHKEQAEKFRLLLEEILKLENSEERTDSLKTMIETVVNENVSLVTSRQILTEISSSLPKLGDVVGKVVCNFALSKIQPRVISFEEQVAAIRQHLADIYEREQCWKEAANILVGIPLETGQK